MGYDIWQRDSSFCIRRENFPGLVKAAIQRFPDLFDEMSSVREIFKGFDFEVDKDAEGNLSDITFTGDRAGNEDELFETIAPFVEPGSSVSFYGDRLSSIVAALQKDSVGGLPMRVSHYTFQLKKMAKLLDGEYFYDSYFYDTAKYTARLDETTMKEIQEKPQDWALVFFDYHF